MLSNGHYSLIMWEDICNICLCISVSVIRHIYIYIRKLHQILGKTRELMTEGSGATRGQLAAPAINIWLTGREREREREETVNMLLSKSEVSCRCTKKSMSVAVEL